MKKGLAIFGFFLVVLSIGFVMGQSACMPDSPIARWSLDGDTNDKIGNHHASISSIAGDGSRVRNGANPVSDGKYGGAYYFDGDQDFLDVGTDRAFTLQEFTIGAWVRTTGCSYGQVFGTGRVAWTSQRNYQFAVSGCRIYYWQGFGRGNEDLWSTGNYVSDGWHHVAMSRVETRPRSGKYLVKLFIDGEFSGSKEFSKIGYDLGDKRSWYRVGIGARIFNDIIYSPPKQILNDIDASIDEIVYYNRGLTDEEMKGLAGECGGPVCGNGIIEDGEDCDGGENCLSDCNLDLCAGVICVDDGNICTVNNCEPATGNCVPKYLDGPCDDGNACSENDFCRTGICRAGPAKVCTFGFTCDSLSGICEADTVGPSPSPTPPTLPTPDSTPDIPKAPVCGDGVIDSGEECDGGVGCDSSCLINFPVNFPLLVHYDFNVVENSRINDESGNGRDGYIPVSGVSIGTDPIRGNFADIDGGIIESADISNLANEKFAYGVWVRWPGNLESQNMLVGQNTNQYLSIKGGSEGIAGRVVLGFLTLAGGNQQRFVITDVGKVVEKNVWTHIFVSYDGSRASIYFNGKLVGVKDIPEGNLAVSSGLATIGNYENKNTDDRFYGEISEIKIYGQGSETDVGIVIVPDEPIPPVDEPIPPVDEPIPPVDEPVPGEEPVPIPEPPLVIPVPDLDCVPDCSNRECGLDPICGLDCGTCTELGAFCDEGIGLCVKESEGIPRAPGTQIAIACEPECTGDEICDETNGECVARIEGVECRVNTDCTIPGDEIVCRDNSCVERCEGAELANVNGVDERISPTDLIYAINRFGCPDFNLFGCDGWEVADIDNSRLTDPSCVDGDSNTLCFAVTPTDAIYVRNRLRCLIEIRIEPICGNGVIEGDEECDDRNIENGDGCNANCRIELGEVGECFDSDDGRNYFEFGRCTSFEIPPQSIEGRPDHCQSIAVLNETYCGDSTVCINEVDGCNEIFMSDFTGRNCNNECGIGICNRDNQVCLDQFGDGFQCEDYCGPFGNGFNGFCGSSDPAELELCDALGDSFTCEQYCRLPGRCVGDPSLCGDGFQCEDYCDHRVVCLSETVNCIEDFGENYICRDGACGRNVEDCSADIDDDGDVDDVDLGLLNDYVDCGPNVVSPICDGWEDFDFVRPWGAECPNDGSPCAAVTNAEMDFVTNNFGIACPFCGDGNIDDGEQCDDRNIIDGDGCNSACFSENIIFVGADGDDDNSETGFSDPGAVYVLSLDVDGTVWLMDWNWIFFQVYLEVLLLIWVI
jgi:cysteine-rich repeat protein